MTNFSGSAPRLRRILARFPGRRVLVVGDIILDEYLFGDGVCAIEWADRIRTLLPHDSLWITLRHYNVAENRRSIVMLGNGPRYEALLREYKRTAFGV